jgi:hypothetical protein
MEGNEYYTVKFMMSFQKYGVDKSQAQMVD